MRLSFYSIILMFDSYGAVMNNRCCFYQRFAPTELNQSVQIFSYLVHLFFSHHSSFIIHHSSFIIDHSSLITHLSSSINILFRHIFFKQCFVQVIKINKVLCRCLPFIRRVVMHTAILLPTMITPHKNIGNLMITDSFP